jgi:mono/diheme cytochrome c family protein
MRTSLTAALLLAAMPALAESDRLERGRELYVQHCASCHGIDLKGEPGHPDWRQRKPNGRLPAPPHDESGHTWHHPDGQLFALTKYGPARLIGDPNYATDMPGFEGVLSDQEIWAVLGYIKSTWSGRAKAMNDRINAQAGSKQ